MPMEPINPEPKPGEYVLPWSADDSREFVGASLDPRFDAVSTFALSSKPPRPSHPVFGPVPRGWVVFDSKHHHTQIVNLREATSVDACGPESCCIHWGGGNFCYVDCAPAEVSRLIAEAQGDE